LAAPHGAVGRARSDPGGRGAGRNAHRPTVRRGTRPNGPAWAGDLRGPGHVRNAVVQPERHRVVPEGHGLLRGGAAHGDVPDRLRGRGRAPVVSSRRGHPEVRSAGPRTAVSRSLRALRPRREACRGGPGFCVEVGRVAPYRGRIPGDARPGMRVPGLVYADATLMAAIRRDAALEQVANAATLPGIVKASFAMPDIHQG